jgi:hypothetical protein
MGAVYSFYKAGRNRQLESGISWWMIRMASARRVILVVFLDVCVVVC